MRRILGAIGFLVVAALFALPFGAARAEERNGSTVVSRTALTWHGVDLVSGGTARPHREELVWGGDPQELRDVTDEWQRSGLGDLFKLPVSSQPAFVIAAVLLLAGAVASLATPARVVAVVCATVAFATLGALLIGHLLLLLDLTHRLHIRLAAILPPAYGFWLACGALLALGVVQEAVARRSRRALSAASGPVD